MVLLHNWNVLCWNIRGLNSPKKQLALSNAISTSGWSIICLQESKMQDFNASILKSICPARFDAFAFIPSLGASGGIITIWCSSAFLGQVFIHEQFALGVEFKSTISSHSWKLVNIYGPCQGEQRDSFTSWLFDIDIPANKAWLLLGDFNYIRSPDNRNKPGGNIQDMFTFNDFIHEQRLTELSIKGRKYTWSNMQQNPLLEQIEWFFMTLNWTSSFPNTMVNPHGRPVSDHTPCSVVIQTSIPKIKIFIFQTSGLLTLDLWTSCLKLGTGLWSLAKQLMRRLIFVRNSKTSDTIWSAGARQLLDSKLLWKIPTKPCSN